eukprot:scaffold266874_cov21-Tisochrysis_lutea.AAC.1
MSGKIGQMAPSRSTKGQKSIECSPWCRTAEILESFKALEKHEQYTNLKSLEGCLDSNSY